MGRSKQQECYLKILLGVPKEKRLPVKLSQEHKDKVTEALKWAHEIRKFEINLYWQRMLYLWGFIIFFMGGYGFLARTILIDPVDNSSRLIPALALSFTACIGFLINLSWIFLEKGAKAHQENWETHIDYLEYEVTGSLHRTLFGEKTNFFSLGSINRFAIRTFLMAWFVFAIAPVLIYLYSDCIECYEAYAQNKNYLLLVPLGFVLLLLLPHLFLTAVEKCCPSFYACCRSFVACMMGWESKNPDPMDIPGFHDTIAQRGFEDAKKDKKCACCKCQFRIDSCGRWILTWVVFVLGFGGIALALICLFTS